MTTLERYIPSPAPVIPEGRDVHLKRELDRISVVTDKIIEGVDTNTGDIESLQTDLGLVQTDVTTIQNQQLWTNSPATHVNDVWYELDPDRAVLLVVQAYATVAPTTTTIYRLDLNTEGDGTGTTYTVDEELYTPLKRLGKFYAVVPAGFAVKLTYNSGTYISPQITAWTETPQTLT